MWENRQLANANIYKCNVARWKMLVNGQIKSASISAARFDVKTEMLSCRDSFQFPYVI